ncbi:MAG: hypothetical protein LV479_04410 [Methylacidiphilales bacterium]|nr:hypothetical protein [Candidatus Methylacidiphilales bacterium]
MPQKTISPAAGLAVRIRKDAHDALRTLNSDLSARSANRMVLRMHSEVLQMAESNPFSVGNAKLLLKMRANPEIRKTLAGIAAQDLTKEMPNNLTVAIKIPFCGAERDQLKRIGHDVRWSVAQVVLEAVQAFLILGGANEPLEQVPALIETYRGIWTYRGRFQESASLVALIINRALGFAPLPISETTTLEPIETFLELI